MDEIIIKGQQDNVNNVRKKTIKNMEKGIAIRPYL